MRLRKVSSCVHITNWTLPFCLILPFFAASESEGFAYEITEWYRDKPAAISVHFDDNTLNHHSVAAPIMNDRDIRGTFHVITGHMGNPDFYQLVQQSHADGHEIASHSVTHPALANLTTEEIVFEVTESKRYIEEHFVGEGNCVVIAYPYGSRDERVINAVRGAGYILGRRVGGAAYVRFTQHTPENYFFEIPTSLTVISETVLEDFVSRLDNAIANNGWYLPMFHGIDGRGWSPISGELFAEMMDAVDARRDQLWIAPIGEVARYSRQRLKAVLEPAVFTDALWTLRLDDGQDNLTYNHPLTIRMPMPPGKRVTAAIAADQSALEWWTEDDHLLLNKTPDGEWFSVFFEVDYPDFITWLAQYRAIHPDMPDGHGDDPAGDRLPNLVKFFAGLNPLQPAVGADFIRLERDEANHELAVHLRRHRQATPVAYVIQSSPDLVAWQDAAPATVDILPLDDHHDWLVHRFPLEDPELFYRLKIGHVTE